MAQPFWVVPGDAVRSILEQDLTLPVSLVAEAYRSLADGGSVNPPSQFLRIPGRPRARHIALPAHLGGRFDVSGIKWIASYPDNIDSGKARASAVVILNRPDDGFPYACLEGSVISAARTAASAVLAAGALGPPTRTSGQVGFVGTGYVAQCIHRMLVANGWAIENLALFDRNERQARRFAAHARATSAADISICPTIADAIVESDLVVFATTATTPHVQDPALFAHCPVVLHISLRDLSPRVIQQSYNVVDAWEHTLQEGTSLALAAAAGARLDSFLTATIGDLLTGRSVLDQADRPRIFSPFGLGVLDLALGHHVFSAALESGQALQMNDFFPSPEFSGPRALLADGPADGGLWGEPELRSAPTDQQSVR